MQQSVEAVEAAVASAQRSAEQAQAAAEQSESRLGAIDEAARSAREAAEAARQSAEQAGGQSTSLGNEAALLLERLETDYDLLTRLVRELHGRIASTLVERFPQTAAASPELVARHYTIAGLTGEAVAYWCKAGRIAAARSANVETRNHLMKGLELLETLPDGPERQRQEIEILATLGPALIALAGFAAEETVQVFRRVRALSEALDDHVMIFPALYGEWLYHAARAEHRPYRDFTPPPAFLSARSGTTRYPQPPTRRCGYRAR